MKKKEFIFALLIVLLTQCGKEEKAEYLLKHFIKTHEADLKRLHEENTKALWAIYTEDWEIDDYYQAADSLQRSFNDKTEAELSIRSMYSNISEHDFLKRLRQSGLIKDSLLERQLEFLYKEYAWANLDLYELNDKQRELTRKFYDIDATKPLQEEKKYLGKDSVLVFDLRRKELLSVFVETVKEKNQAAIRAGFKDYWDFWLNRNEITNIEQEKLMQAIEKSTRDDYLKLKHGIDSLICQHKGIKRCGISYSDFYFYIYKIGYPPCWSMKLDQDSTEQLLIEYLRNKGFKTNDLFAKSDIWYRKDKIPGEFVVNIDSYYDVRIYANIKPTLMGLNTLLHEVGHTLYFKGVGEQIPYILREPNLVMNEGVAFMFQSLILNDAEFRSKIHLPDPKSKYFENIRLPYMLFITRDLLVRAELEKEIFKNPDQDINKLFWDLKKKYFYYDQPEDEKMPLWIQDKHLIHNSGVYQAYLYATVIGGMLLEEVKENDAYGTWFTNNIFEYGNSVYWRDLLKNNNKKLTAEYISNLYR